MKSLITVGNKKLYIEVNLYNVKDSIPGLVNQTTLNLYHFAFKRYIKSLKKSKKWKRITTDTNL